MENSGENDSILRYGEREVRTFTGEQSTKSTVTKPEGQPSGGYSFPSGGGVYINTSGGSNVTLSFSLGGTFGSVGVSVGTASASNIGGLFAKFPANKNHYIVKLRHNFILKRYRIDTYQYDKLKYTTYKVIATLSSVDTYIERV